MIIENIYVNIQKTDLINIDGVDYVVLDADARKDRSGSHLKIKQI